ncbi:hypothetical protein H5410_027402 [Solanum commersonii]|uniref:Uncharacterized protein n=1 Tax=Solanum commersonii TaxID=4109 RepID=A0A9J5Z4C7_SOLCO|nr:hypothetical protein H5410_027402 [Solanum commersonii]
MDESITPPADILVSPVLHSGNVLVCSPTLVLSGEKSPNSEAQSMVKPNVGLPMEEIDVGSMAVSSTISERLFEGDLPEGKGPESCILTGEAELVAVQSLASLRGDVQPTLLEHELESPDQVSRRSEPIFDQTPKFSDVRSDKKEEEEEIPLRWCSRGVRGGNHSQVNVPELETVKGYGSAIATSKAQTERARKRRREGVELEQPTSTCLSIENSETESEDVAKYVAKKRREADEERIKSMGSQKWGKKSAVKRVKSPAKSVKVKKQKPLAKG